MSQIEEKMAHPLTEENAVYRGQTIISDTTWDNKCDSPWTIRPIRGNTDLGSSHRGYVQRPHRAATEIIEM